MRNTLIATVLVAGLLPAQTPKPTQEELAAARESGIEGRLGFGFTNQYFFRGIRQEAAGVIFQPWIELGYDLLDDDTGLQDLRFVVGQWNSLHNGRTGPNGAIWYESQFYVGLEGQLADRWHVATRFNTYSTPNGAGFVTGLRNIEELAFYGRFDDEGVFSDDWALQPTVTLAFELNNSRDGLAGDEGIYLELGVAPAFEVGKLGDSDVTVTVPAKVGLSLGDYYEAQTGGNDDFFGYFQVGGVASMPLNYLPARLGPWRGDVGLHLLVLGDNNENRNGGDTAEILFTVGMSTVF
mgnify:CR=1 FL=1